MDKEKLKLLLKTWEDKWIKADKVWEWFVRIYWEIDNKPMVELESFQIVVREREKLKKEKQELEYLWDINEELKEENEKLKERIKEYENLPFKKENE